MRVIVLGASGGIGSAFIQLLSQNDRVKDIYALSRQGLSLNDKTVYNLTCDFTEEESLIAAAESLRETGVFDLIIVATGKLQGEGMVPEKNIRAMTYDGFSNSFMTNAIGPAMTAKYFLPLLRSDKKSVFAALSARVGSLSDNRLGGWYAYRASKAALNMIIKTLSIESGRRYKDKIIIGLHPGTVDTSLSKPFQGNVPDGKLFTPEYSAKKLLEVIEATTLEDSGNLLAWDGETIPF